MKIIFLFLYSAFATASDPSCVSYWLNCLERISVHEEQLAEASEWVGELEPGAMDDWSEGLRRQIRAEMEKIDRECTK